jgi:tripartite-type tricarboxylate transporter receptor subunit TctC
VVTLGIGLSSGLAAGQSYPTKPVRFITPSSSGSSDDFHARLMAQKFTEVFGQQFVVDNRPGAGGLIGQMAVVNAAPDGYTLLLTGRSLTAAPFLNANVTFDPMRSFAPVAQLVTYQFVLVVHPSVRANTVSELIALAQARPGKVSYAATQGGLMAYIAPTIFRAMAKIDMLYVPYKTGGQIYNDLLSGQVDSFFAPLVGTLPYITNGKLRALGVTGATRSPVLPDVPTIAEAAVTGYEAGSWLFIAAPARTPRSVIDILNSATARILAMPDVRERLLAVGSEPAPSSPEEITRRLAEATEQFGRIAKELGLKPQ